MKPKIYSARIEEVCESAGYRPAILCTPEELLELNGNETMKTWTDPVVAEVRKIRRAHAAAFRYDLDAIFQDVQAKQQTSGRQYVRFPPRRYPGPVQATPR